MPVLIGEEHWECPECGWSNVLLRKRCRNFVCTYVKPIKKEKKRKK